MQRIFIIDVPITSKPGEFLARKGDVRDYPLNTWIEISKSINPKAKDHRKNLDSFTESVANIGRLIPDKRKAA